MKKLLLAFAILGFVACNNEGDTKTATDTAATVAPAADTTAPAADTTMKKDTTAPAVDTAAKK